MFDFITTMNGGFLMGMAIVAIVVLVMTRKSDYGARVAHRMSVRARLPFGTDAVAVSVRRRSRTLVRWNMWGLLLTVAVAAVIFAATSLSSSPQFLFLVTLILFLAVLTTTSVIVNLRERLFAPLPSAVRIARARPMAVADYLASWQRRTPGVVLAAASLATGALALTQLSRSVDPLAAAITYISLAVSALVFLAARLAEHAVLAQPQPASNTLELGWDDLFRTDTLSVLRMGTAMAAWIPAGLALMLVSTTWLLPYRSTHLEYAGLFPWWGIPALQVLYSLMQGKLRPALYPDIVDIPTSVPEPETA